MGVGVLIFMLVEEIRYIGSRFMDGIRIRMYNEDLGITSGVWKATKC